MTSSTRGSATSIGKAEQRTEELRMRSGDAEQRAGKVVYQLEEAEQRTEEAAQRPAIKDSDSRVCVAGRGGWTVRR